MRIGIAGTLDNGERGWMMKDLATVDWVKAALYRGNQVTAASALEGCQIFQAAHRDDHLAADAFLSIVDVVIVLDHPVTSGLVQRAEDHGCLIVLVPTPLTYPWPWFDFVDIVWSPTAAMDLAMDKILELAQANDRPRSWEQWRGIGWGVDLTRFFDMTRGRKAKRFCLPADPPADAIVKAVCEALPDDMADRTPDFQLNVHTSLTAPHWPPGGFVWHGWINHNRPSFREAIHQDADVIVFTQPMSMVGLQAMEAAVCGVPVIVPDADPWLDLPHLDTIDVARQTWNRRPGGHFVMDYHVEPAAVADKIQEWMDVDLTEHTRGLRAEALNTFDIIQAVDPLFDLILDRLRTGN